MLTVLITALVLGVFIPIVQATMGAASDVRERVVVDVYVAEGASPAERDTAKRAIEQTANVQSVAFVSKEEALARAREKNPRAFREGSELLGSNPLPASFRIVPDDPNDVGRIVDRLAPKGPDGRARAPADGHRRGALPRGGHQADPLGHRPGHRGDGRRWPCCW